MGSRILVVEDTIEFQKLIQATLGFKYTLDVVGSLAAARTRVMSSSYSLILLDVILPDGSGFDFCREVQFKSSNEETPIILLTAKTASSDKVLGFSIGVDDYITKPFDPVELLARVDSRIQKSIKKKELAENFKRGPFRFDVIGMAVFLEHENREQKIDMTPIEFKIFFKLAQNSNRVISRQQMLDSIWGHGVYIEDRCIDKHISTLRKKLTPHGRCIKTVSGIGYEFRS